MMERMRMKPSQIKECCENEPFWKKVKIACLSIFMGAVATTYGGYFDNLVFRSGMFQQQLLGNKVTQTNFIDKLTALGLKEAGDAFYQPTGDWSASKRYA